MIFMRCLVLCLGILCSLSSCGYHLDRGEGLLTSRYNSISVPYVEGDEYGDLTAAVVREIVQSGAFEYQAYGGALILQIREVDCGEEHIGFRYDRRRSGKLTDDIIPTETRITEMVEISVIESASGCMILGPVRLSAYIDYDHDYYFSRNGVNVFSLGQLIDIDEAKVAARTPLNEKLAHKIVDYLTQSW